MKIGNLSVKVFKIKNRSGYAALCADHLAEGSSPAQACERMKKALKRTRTIKK